MVDMIPDLRILLAAQPCHSAPVQKGRTSTFKHISIACRTRQACTRHRSPSLHHSYSQQLNPPCTFAIMLLTTAVPPKRKLPPQVRAPFAPSYVNPACLLAPGHASMIVSCPECVQCSPGGSLHACLQPPCRPRPIPINGAQALLAKSEPSWSPAADPFRLTDADMEVRGLVLGSGMIVACIPYAGELYLARNAL